jgi:hypothetical protein
VADGVESLSLMERVVTCAAFATDCCKSGMTAPASNAKADRNAALRPIILLFICITLFSYSFYFRC